MGTATPTPELDQRYSSGGAPPTAWDEARERLIRADVYWTPRSGATAVRT